MATSGRPAAEASSKVRPNGSLRAGLTNRPPRLAGIGVDRRHVLRAMRLRVGDAPVEVVAVDQHEEVAHGGRHVAVERVDILSGAGHDHEVGARLKLRTFAVGPDQGREILSRHRRASASSGGLCGSRRKRSMVASTLGWGRLAANRAKSLPVAGRVRGRDRRSLAGILHFRLVARRGDDEGGAGERGFFGGDPACQIRRRYGVGSEGRQLDPSERMGGEHEGMPRRSSTRPATAAASA